MTINLFHPDLVDTVALLRRVGDSLETERRATDREVDTLLDGGWSGGAARAYREGWEEWRAGCDDVLAALHTMAELITRARAELVERDDTTRVDLTSLSAHLVGRLG